MSARSPERRRNVWTVASVVACAVIIGLGLLLSSPSPKSPTADTHDSAKASLLYASLGDISCPSSNRCVAVGEYLSSDTDSKTGDPDGDGQATRTLAEVFGGKRWRITPSPNRGKGGDVLDSISCPSANDCVAAGYYRPAKYPLRATVAPPNYPLLESYDGHAWRVVVKLPKSLPNSVLSSVSCPTRGRCVAVGYATKSQRNGEAIESLFVESLKNGAWTITSPATPPDTSAALDAISCPDDSSCLTVGTVAPRNALTRTHPIVEQLDGSSWTQVSLPANGDGPGLLSDVACSSVGYCTAVGRSEVRGGTDSALVLTLLGTSWTTNTDALEQPGNLSLTSVGCATDGGCVAVGSSWPSITKPPRHIVARIDGTSWQELHTSTGTANIENVTCTESTLCLFVGSVTRNLFGNTTTFIASLSGTTWKQQQSPSP